jgi:hypothetical protein
MKPLVLSPAADVAAAAALVAAAAGAADAAAAGAAEEAAVEAAGCAAAFPQPASRDEIIERAITVLIIFFIVPCLLSNSVTLPGRTIGITL